MKYFLLFIFYALVIGSTSCSSSIKISGSVQQPYNQTINAIKLLGKYVIPHNLSFQETTVGGLSGIDYDAANDLYYLICDDRSDINPARYYSAKIAVTPHGIDTVIFQSTHPLFQPNGEVYPNSKQDPLNTPDPEAMRYNPRTKTLVWSSEGERIVNTKDTILENPAINTIKLSGKNIFQYPLPQNLYMHAEKLGPRRNGVLEGLTFADNYQSLFVNVEEPLYEDGPRADLTENKAYIRILKFNMRGLNTNQYAYKLEPVAHPSIHPDSFRINGVSDILSISENKLLTVERSFSVGHRSNTIRIFIADLSNATDLYKTRSLIADTSFVPAAKKLLLNMDELGFYIDNVEGVTFGPKLPNGHQTLVFIVDNNFNVNEEAQVFLFEIE